MYIRQCEMPPFQRSKPPPPSQERTFARVLERFSDALGGSGPKTTLCPKDPSDAPAISRALPAVAILLPSIEPRGNDEDRKVIWAKSVVEDISVSGYMLFHVCTCVYIYIYIYVYVHVYVYLYVVYICIYILVCVNW